MKKRVLICEFHQETNTFNPVLTSLERYHTGLGFEGETVFQDRMTRSCPIHGAVDAITEAGGEVIPTVFLYAHSGGKAEDNVLEYVCRRIGEYAEKESFDAIYADLHGATCAQSEDDACGALLAFLRSLAKDRPIAASFDLHANITEKVLENADIICGFQTYPHNDHYRTAYRAAKLCMDMLAGKQFSMASAAVPMLVPPAGYSTNEGPFLELIQYGQQLVKEGKLLDFTVFPVQPWLDINEIASRVVAIGKDPQQAKAWADDLAQKLCGIREQMQPELLTVDQIIDIAEENTAGKPVILSEAADSPNGGCVGDSVVVAMRLLARNSQLRASLPVVDPDSVEKAFSVGVGNKGRFCIGAGFTPGMPGPLEAEGAVLSLHDGSFLLEGPAHRGKLVTLGKCAVVRMGNIDILLCTKGGASGDPQLLRHFGIEPSLYDLVVVKANTSFRLPYSQFTDLMYCADTIGAGASNLKQLTWRNLPAGIYPFTEDIKPEKARLW